MPLLLTLMLLSVPASSGAGTEPSFLPAASCGLCHSRIPPPEDSAAASIAPGALWPGSMMAHASRDPFWRAKAQEEVSQTPAAAAAIEDRCLRCHAPTQQYPLRQSGGMQLRDLEPGAEGVTCTVCHQISPDSIGGPASYSGSFEIDRKAEIYGPHGNPFSMPMLHHTGLTPVEAPHLTAAALCGSCHTVMTPTLRPDGRTAGVFLEQAPYLEWLAGDFARADTTCQSCHVPVLREGGGTALPQYIAHMPPGRWFPPTRPRTPFGLHFFAGANVSMADLLARREPDSATALRRTAAKASENLRSALSLRASAAFESRKLRVAVELRNRTGHKLPSGFPSRRVWLHVEVFSATGSRIFESGAWDETGKILRAADSFDPHRSRVTRPEQSMIYQAVMADSAGVPTTSLLRAASYLKDNRIPPSGFRADLDPRIAPVGTSGDAGFRPGEHRVEYEIAFSRRAEPARVHVEAVYQSIDPAYLPAADSAALRPATTPVVMASSDLSLKSRK